MTDILTQIYYLVDENLPLKPKATPLEKSMFKAEARLIKTLNKQQSTLFEAYSNFCGRVEDQSKVQLFYAGLSLGMELSRRFPAFIEGDSHMP